MERQNNIIHVKWRKKRGLFVGRKVTSEKA